MKIAFFDIDGTLVNVPHGLIHPTKKTIHALKTFKEQGNIIVIATARGEAPDSVKDIDFDGYICNDGHFITYHNEVIIEDLFEKELIQKQMDVYKKYNGRYMFNSKYGRWCSYLDDELVVKHRMMFDGTSDKPTNVIEEFKAEDVKTLSCCVLFDCVEDLMNAYEELKEDCTMSLYKTGLIRMDVYKKGYTKGTACEFLYKRLGINYEDTYAFGDGVNDKEMIQLVKYGIAMGNAVDELKEIAYDITESVDQDGIAKAFYKYFKI